MGKVRKSRSRRPKQTKEMHHSHLWYLLPILLGIVGGLIGYFFFRNKDRQIANRLLTWGIIFTILSFAFQAIWTTFASTDILEVTKTTQSFP